MITISKMMLAMIESSRLTCKNGEGVHIPSCMLKLLSTFSCRFESFQAGKPGICYNKTSDSTDLKILFTLDDHFFLLRVFSSHFKIPFSVSVSSVLFLIVPCQTKTHHIDQSLLSYWACMQNVWACIMCMLCEHMCAHMCECASPLHAQQDKPSNASAHNDLCVPMCAQAYAYVCVSTVRHAYIQLCVCARACVCAYLSKHEIPLETALMMAI